MEIRAAIQALASIPPGSTAIVFSDSRYVVCSVEDWYETWETNGWRKSNGKPVSYPELWRQLIALKRERNVKFDKVPGHSGHKWNDLADELATAAAAEARAAELTDPKKTLKSLGKTRATTGSQSRSC